MEPPNEVPTVISRSARDAAIEIDRAVEEVMAEAGMTRQRTGALLRATEKLVQLAINRELHRTICTSIHCRN